ncbi:MAG: hypothetical protein ACKFI0_00570 [Candidatus Hodgkinia cicadicola]
MTSTDFYSTVLKSRIVRFIKLQFVTFKIPKYANALYVFGAILLFALLLQISSGTTIAIHYLPSSADAFWCVNRMVRAFRFGWLVKAAHNNGASLMFLALYIHIFRSFYYRSYVFPRRLVWFIGS